MTDFPNSPTLSRNTRINLRILDRQTGSIIGRIPTTASLAHEAAVHLEAYIHHYYAVDLDWVEPRDGGPAIPFPRTRRSRNVS